MFGDQFGDCNFYEFNCLFSIFLARVQGTAKQIKDLEKQAEENMQLTKDAKMKVKY